LETLSYKNTPSFKIGDIVAHWGGASTTPFKVIDIKIERQPNLWHESEFVDRQICIVRGDRGVVKTFPSATLYLYEDVIQKHRYELELLEKRLLQAKDF
jgi:hypothetical protein